MVRIAAATLVTISASAAWSAPMLPPASTDSAPPAMPAAPEPYSVFALTAELGATLASNGDLNPGPAPSLGVDVGVRTDAATAVGIHLSFAELQGTAGQLFGMGGYNFTTIPIDVAAFASERFLDVAWGGAFVGGHFDRYSDERIDHTTTWSGNVTFGLMLGLDFVRFGDQRIGVFALAESELSDDGYVGLSFGLTYRR